MPTQADKNKDRDKEQSTTKDTPVLGFGEGETSPLTASPEELEKADVDTSEADALDKQEPVALYNQHAGLAPRLGGPYLDRVELEEAERRRAAVERRDPDFKNMAGSAGVPLVTAPELVRSATNVGTTDATNVLAQMVTDNEKNDDLGPKPLAFAQGYGDLTQDVKQNDEGNRVFSSNKDVTSHDNGIEFTAPSDAGRGK